jgi:hypothetical protein
MGLLAQAESLARLVHVLASAVVLGAWAWCARAAFTSPDPGREIAPRQPLFRRQT